MIKTTKLMLLAFAIILTMTTLVSCGPSASKAEDKLEDKGYTVIVSDNESLLGKASIKAMELLTGLESGSIECIITAVSKDGACQIIYTDSRASANTIKDCGKDDVKGEVVKVSGSVFCSGDEQALKDAGFIIF